MKYLAILKDSVREAIDNKVIFVLVGLSLLVTLFVMTCSFKPLPAEKVMKQTLRDGLPGMRQFLAMAQAHAGKGPPPRHIDPPAEFVPGEFTILGVESLDGRDDPESRFRVMLVLPLAGAAQLEEARKDPEASIARLRSRFARVQEFGVFTVTGARLAPAGNRFAVAKDAPPHALYFEMTTEPGDSARLGWPYEYGLFMGGVPLGGGTPLGVVLILAAQTVLWIGSLVTILTSVIVTAFFVPNMLRKGTVDMLLVKPVRRPALLVYKYVGGLTFIFVNTTIAILGLWLGLGISAGVWANGFLLMIFVYTFFFAILYAVSTLFAVLIRSAIAAILLTCAAWFILFLVGALNGFGSALRQQEERLGTPAEERVGNNGFFLTMRAIHAVLPRTRDLDELGNDALMRDFTPPKFHDLLRMGQKLTINWGESIGVSLAFIAVMLGLACWRFSAKDY